MTETVFNTVLNANNGGGSPAMDGAGTHWTAFRSVVEARRSVRVFDGTPIPEAVMNDCLDMALLAPNSSNLQPWEFYWVRSPDKKVALVKACLSQPAARTAAELVVCVARVDTWRRNCAQILAELSKEPKVPAAALHYYRKLVPLANTQGPLGLFGLAKKVGIFFAGFAKPVPREPTSHTDMLVWATKSVSLACENLMLALSAHGFDSCPMEGMDSKRVKRLLGLPRGAIVQMVIGCGKRAPHGVYGPRLRLARTLFVKEV